MTTGNILNEIEAALATFAQEDLVVAGRRLLDTLGYRSERRLELPGPVNDFIREFAAENPGTKSEERLREDTKSVRILFQITDSEIVESQPSVLDTGEFDKGNEYSFIFIAVELRGRNYSRGKYAEFTREVNKRLNQPTVVLFRTASGLISLAFVRRRKHKRDQNRRVLRNVSLIREIDTRSPHRAHRDILHKLALSQRLSWMNDRHKPHNFDSLLDAWLDALDTEELNRSFYKQLFTWFERAVEEARFPDNQVKTLKPEEHVIRLITRLLFVWFIKEKGLIAPELFVEAQVRPLLRDYDSQNGSSYYRAVLQNLFFATLNSEIATRRFSTRSRDDHREPSLYRFKEEISDPVGLRKLFDRTPFINGGLFDCLDSYEATGEGGYRIDCFTDNVIDPKRTEFDILSIPNWLFFDKEEGLISLFDRFQFTVEENTPAEQEVALDPELLGKVFENLLAANVEESKENARRESGSYYTPRAIVDYIVDESLVASLAQKCPPPDGDAEFWKERLSYLLDYEDAFDDAHELFEETERKGLVRAIAGLKLLDPAVGSGAFPMGALHKLTLALRRLDPQNTLWESLQKELAGQRAAAAFETPEQAERNVELEQISATFEQYRDSDFGRKLYLIQNCIYGVDIQPIACQISKLRFFISLAIEQEPDPSAGNLGIKPLPNLETKFVAANTLIGLDLSIAEPLLQEDTIQRLQRKITANRERYFLPSSRQKKVSYIREGDSLSEQLQQALKDELLDWDEKRQCEIENKVAQIPNPTQAAKLKNDLLQSYRTKREDFLAGLENAQRIASWTPFDQNFSADWFDAKYMFGVAKGFDVVLGNPPYIQLSKDGGKLGKVYKDAGYSTFASTGDIYLLFFEKGCDLLKPGQGLLSYITSNSWLKAEYGKRLRRFFSENHTPLRMLEMGKDIFENAIVDTCILIVREGKSEETGIAVDMDRLHDRRFPPEQDVWGSLRVDGERHWIALSATEQRIIDKMEAIGTSLNEWDISIKYGIKTGYNAAFVIDDETREAIIGEDPKSENILKPVMRGKDIQRFQAKWERFWLIDTHNGYETVPPVDVTEYKGAKQHLDKFSYHLESRKDKGITPYNLRDCAYHEEFKKEKLFWRRVAKEGTVAYVKDEVQCINAVYMLRGDSLRYLCATLNAKLVAWFMQRSLPTSGTGTFHWEKVHVERLPVPKLTSEEQLPFNQLVDRILTAKNTDPSTNTSELEAEIDWLVYDLYGLTDEEIAVVEGNS